VRANGDAPEVRMMPLPRTMHAHAASTVFTFRLGAVVACGTPGRAGADA
jgi:hypothetical protein